MVLASIYQRMLCFARLSSSILISRCSFYLSGVAVSGAESYNCMSFDFYMGSLFVLAATSSWPSSQELLSGARGPPQFLKKRSENAGANENLSRGFPSIPGIAPGVAPRIVVFVLLKSWDAIPRMEFCSPRMEFRILRVAPRIPRHSPRAPRMVFALRERFS